MRDRCRAMDGIDPEAQRDDAFALIPLLIPGRLRHLVELHWNRGT